MTSRRPYLLRALYQWSLDNRTTPHILVNANFPEVQVPQDYVKDGQIILNIAPSAVKGLSMGNDVLGFNARFRGIPMDVSVPIGAIMGLYVRENGQGMMFDPEPLEPEPPPGPSSATKPRKKRSSGPTPINKGKRPELKVVK